MNAQPSTAWEPIAAPLLRSTVAAGGEKEGVVAEALIRQLLDRGARLGILEHCNDLFLRVPFPCHGPLLWGPSQHK